MNAVKESDSEITTLAKCSKIITEHTAEERQRILWYLCDKFLGREAGDAVKNAVAKKEGE